MQDSHHYINKAKTGYPTRHPTVRPSAGVLPGHRACGARLPEKAVPAGVADYLQKPVDVEALLSVARRYFG